MKRIIQILKQARGRAARWMAYHQFIQKGVQKLVDTEAWGQALLADRSQSLVCRKGQLLRLHQWGWGFSETLLLELAEKVLQGNLSPLEKRGLIRDLLDLKLSQDALQQLFVISGKGKWLVLHGAVADQERAELAGKMILHHNSNGKLWTMMAQEAWQTSPVASSSPPIRKILLSFPPARKHPEVRTLIYERGVPEHLFVLLREANNDWRRIFLKLTQKRPSLALEALKEWPDKAKNALQPEDWPKLMGHEHPDIRQCILRMIGNIPPDRAITGVKQHLSETV